MVFLPNSMMVTVIAPIIKNKAGDLSDNNNYRPIALATVASKLFEYLILSRVSILLTTCANKFGFKKDHSTEMLIFLLKEIFRDYIANGSSMYVTMLDASKAFDRVNHSKLFCKLIDRGCPAFIVRILYYWYSTQKFTIRWCHGLSKKITVCNGVKQGGILSPHLFNVYMDDLSVILNKLQIGCIYAGTIINHLMYADDLCIFSPSVSGLRKLTNCCEKYGDIFNITYNVNKSYCVVIDNTPQTMTYTHPVILNNNVLPYTTKCKYLGHIINNNLTDDDDIARQKRCFYAQANVLARKFRFCSSGIKNVLFHSYFGTIYTSSLWCKFKKQSLKSVNVAYNNSFRILHHLPSRCSASFLFVSNHIKSFNELTRSSIFSLLRRLQDSKNPLFVNYFYTDIHVTIRELVRMRMRFSVNEDRTPLNFIALYWFGLTDENPVSSSQFTAVSLIRSGCRRKRKVMDNRRNSTTTILLVVSAQTEVSPALSPDASSIPLPRERA